MTITTETIESAIHDCVEVMTESANAVESHSTDVTEAINRLVIVAGFCAQSMLAIQYEGCQMREAMEENMRAPNHPAEQPEIVCDPDDGWV